MKRTIKVELTTGEALKVRVALRRAAADWDEIAGDSDSEKIKRYAESLRTLADKFTRIG